MRLKRGVRVHGLGTEILLAVIAASNLIGTDLVITSGIEGKHSRASKHYGGDAIDIRTRNLEDPSGFADALKRALGDDFDVILESNHIHVEYDPKEHF